MLNNNNNNNNNNIFYLYALQCEGKSYPDTWCESETLN